MDVKKWIPEPSQIVREGIIVVAGAVLAALVFSQLPAFRAWVSERLPTRP